MRAVDAKVGGRLSRASNPVKPGSLEIAARRGAG